MSRLKLSPNLFLEVNELKRQNKFLEEEGYKRLFKAIVKSFGIVRNESNSYFKVTLKPGSSNILVINKGIAFNSNLDAIVKNEDTEMEIANTGINRWLILSRAVSNWEEGTVEVNSDGSLSGMGTEFLSVLRGQPNFPVKVKFESTKNNGVYEVVSVTSDSSAIISGSFVPESGMKYSVIGTFTPGFQPDEGDAEIYEYDSYNIAVVDSDNKPSVNSDQYIIAGISFDASGAIDITDERINYMFNNPYIQGADTSGNIVNPITSLLAVGLIRSGGDSNIPSVDLELIAEHGYTISKYDFKTTPTSNQFSILEGRCNFLGDGNIPDNLFKGWLLLNRKNMKYAEIDGGNENKNLFISNFDSTIIEEADNDFVVIPNFDSVEYEVKVSNNVKRPSIPFRFKSSVFDVNTRMRIYAFFPSASEDYGDEVSISVKYRLIDKNGKQFAFSNLAIAQFENIQGQMETLSESYFTVNLKDIEPQAKQRNYS